MHLGKLSYVVTMGVFIGMAALLVLSFARHKLKNRAKFIIAALLYGLITTGISDPMAVEWRAWAYDSSRFSGIYIWHSPLETFLLGILCAVIIAAATLIWSDVEDDGRPLIRSTIDRGRTLLGIRSKPRR